MKQTALILCGDPRLSRFLVTELGYLGVDATSVDTPAVFSGDDTTALASVAEAGSPALIVADGDACSEAARSWLSHSAPCPTLNFARREAHRLSPVGTGYASLFLRRPFSIADLDGAVSALLSPGGTEGAHPLPLTATGTVSSDNLTVTQGDGTATVQGHNVPLTATESAILACLLAHRGEIVPRDTLAPLTGGGNSVDVYVCRLRRKLEKPIGIRLIHTVRGQGYRLR